MSRLPSRPTYERFVHALLRAGFSLDESDLSWRHENGAIASVEAVEDIVELYPGLTGVFLKILKAGRPFNVTLTEDPDGMGVTLRVEAQMVLDRLVEETREDEADTIAALPKATKHLSPWRLYMRFCDAVKGKYPDAVLPRTPKKKYLRWAKQLLASYDEENIDAMIRLLVLDYEQIPSSRIFFKYGGTPTPTFEQFFANVDTLATLIGRGFSEDGPYNASL